MSTTTTTTVQTFGDTEMRTTTVVETGPARTVTDLTVELRKVGQDDWTTFVRRTDVD